MRPPRIRDQSSCWRSFSSVVPSLIMTEDRRAPMESSFGTESQSFLHEVRNYSEWPDKLLQRLMSRRNGTIASARQLATSTLASIIARESGATQRRNPRDRV